MLNRVTTESELQGQQVTVGYKVHESGEERSFTVFFSGDELRQLRLFLRHVEELKAAGVLQQGLACSTEMTATPDDVAWKVSMPDRASLSVLLHHLRPLILQQEEANFLKTAKLVARRVEDSRLRGVIKNLRREYDGRNGQAMMKLEHNGKVLNSDEALFEWLNGFEYHRDEEKRQGIEAIRAIPRDVVLAVLIGQLVDKVRAILGLEQFVAVLVYRRDTPVLMLT